MPNRLFITPEARKLDFQRKGNPPWSGLTVQPQQVPTHGGPEKPARNTLKPEPKGKRK